MREILCDSDPLYSVAYFSFSGTAELEVHTPPRVGIVEADSECKGVSFTSHTYTYGTIGGVLEENEGLGLTYAPILTTSTYPLRRPTRSFRSQLVAENQ